MSSDKYIKSSYSTCDARKQLFSEVLQLDYMKGPTKTFNLNNKLWVIHNSPLVDMLEPIGNISSEKRLAGVKSSYLSYLDTFLVIADFYAELKSQVPKEKKSLKGAILKSFADMSVYFKKQDETLALYFKGDFVRKDDKGKKYVQLTESGEKALSEIWGSNDRFNSCKIIPFSKLDDVKDFGVMEESRFESVNILQERKNRKKNKDVPLRTSHEQDDYRELVDPEFIAVSNDAKTPSLLTQNVYGSVGFNDEYKTSDESIIGSRESIRREEHFIGDGTSKRDLNQKSRKM